MLPSLYLDLPEQEAVKEFASARTKALMHRIGPWRAGWVSRRSTRKWLRRIIVGSSVLVTYWISKDK